MKTPVIWSDKYIVYLEEHAGASFIHCDCFDWSKGIKTSLINDLEKLLQIHRKPVFAIHEIDDKKHLKFLSITGFSFYQNFIGQDNNMRQLYVRNL